MAAPALTARVRDVVEPIAVAAGLYLEDVEIHGTGPRSTVRIVLDLEESETGAVDLERIAEASRDISVALDAVAELDSEYTLEVSSPGTARPLTELRHFRRARGRLVTLALHDGRTVTGRLTQVEPTALTVAPEPVAAKKGGPTREQPPVDVPFADVAHGRVEVELARAMTVDLGPEDDDESEDED